MERKAVSCPKVSALISWIRLCWRLLQRQKGCYERNLLYRAFCPPWQWKKTRLPKRLLPSKCAEQVQISRKEWVKKQDNQIPPTLSIALGLGQNPIQIKGLLLGVLKEPVHYIKSSQVSQHLLGYGAQRAQGHQLAISPLGNKVPK